MSADDIDACQAWYVLYGASGEQCGPYTKDTILTGGFVDLDTQVWCELLPGWTTARNVPFMAAHLGQPDPDPSGGLPSPVASATVNDDIAHDIAQDVAQELQDADQSEDTVQTSLSDTMASQPVIRIEPVPGTGSALPTSSGSPSGNVRVDMALQVVQAEFAALSQRRVPLAYPVLDLNRFVDDIEGTAFMGCSEEFILSQIYNEIVKERQAHLEANEVKLQAAQQRQRDSFACLAEALVKAIQALETDTDKIITTAAQTIAIEYGGEASSIPADVGTRLTGIRTMSRNELQFCQRMVERHGQILASPPLFTFYKGVLLALMQYWIGTRFMLGAGGPDKARYKSRIKTDAVLTALVKKGIDVQGATWAVPKGNAAVQLMQMLDDQILQVHAEHIILPDFFARCSQYARLVGGVQLCADMVAQTLTFRYEEQIRQLVCSSSQHLAEVACSAMLIMLGKGIPPSANTKSPLVSFLVASVQDESVAKVGGKRFGKKEKLETVRGSKDTWNAVGIFRKTGVRIASVDDQGADRIRYFEGGLFEANPAKYGYRLGSEAECIALSMTETFSRQRLDMQVAAGGSPRLQKALSLDRFALGTHVPVGGAGDRPPPKQPLQVPTADALDSPSRQSTLDLPSSSQEPDAASPLTERIGDLEDAVADLQAENDALRRDLLAVITCLQQAGLPGAELLSLSHT
ncbi:GYF domain-containing protein [Plasmodiophora brassicae]